VYSTLDDANVASRMLKLFVPSVRVYAREANVANNKSIKFKIADIFLNFLSTKIVSCSPLVEETLIPYQPFHKHKMVVVENGIEIPDEVPSREGRDTVTILTVGSLDPKKRHIFLLRAVTRLLNADFDWKLFAVGGGPLEQELREFVSTHGLSEHVVLTGTKTKEEVSGYYKAADMFVFVPEWEGGPNVILEAMSYGLPCVSTRRVGEKIEDGVTGFLVEYGDEATLAEKIAEIARNHALRRSMGIAARIKLIHENSMEAHLKRLRSVLELD
jgi:glycosyltransferase involved in cell wall biosynthesis